MKILVLNGPNLNLLGEREPDKYGSASLAELNLRLVELGGQLGVLVECFQSNSEGALVDRVHQAKRDGFKAAIVNAGAYTHTSIALRDALLATQLKFIEVHITNVHAREPFRQVSYLSDIANGVIVGLGVRGYAMALLSLTGLSLDQVAPPAREPSEESE